MYQCLVYSIYQQPICYMFKILNIICLHFTNNCQREREKTLLFYYRSNTEELFIFKAVRVLVPVVVFFI